MQSKPENLPSSLMHSVVNDYTSSALMEFGESMLDDLTDAVVKSDIVAHIPVISGIVGLVKVGLSVRDRRYLSKLMSFLSETAKANSDDREKYRKKLDSDPSECKKAGETILDLIDKITSTEKAIMIGKVFRAFMHEGFTTNQLITLCEMIEKAYLSDLVELSKTDSPLWNDAHLESVGIKKPMRVEDVNRAIEVVMDRMPRIRERPIDPADKPEVIESGFTESGDMLRRILKEY